MGDPSARTRPSLISSAGQSVNADIDAHLVVSPNPIRSTRWRLPTTCNSTAIGKERFLPTRSTSWDGTAATTVCRSRTPRRRADAATQRCVLVMGSPDERHCARNLASEATGRNDLLFVGSFQAEVSMDSGRWLMPGLTPHAHAVILVGDCPAPAEALAFGTPILRVSGNDGIDTGELRAALAIIRGGQRCSRRP